MPSRFRGRALSARCTGPLALLAGILLGIPACQPVAPSAIPVAGKTVYRGMGVEDATVTATPVNAVDGPIADRASSGYHGSFLLHLPPGTYRLRAVGALPGPKGKRILVGFTAPLEIPVGARRFDRVVIPLEEVAALPSPSKHRPTPPERHPLPTDDPGRSASPTAPPT